MKELSSLKLAWFLQAVFSVPAMYPGGSCRNIFGTIAILAAFGPFITKRRTVYFGLGTIA